MICTSKSQDKKNIMVMLNLISIQANTNQSQMRCHFAPSTMAIMKRTCDNKWWQGCERSDSSHTDGGNVKWYKCFGNQKKKKFLDCPIFYRRDT